MAEEGTGQGGAGGGAHDGDCSDAAGGETRTAAIKGFSHVKGKFFKTNQ